MDKEVKKCHICGEPYNYYPFYGGDQSACPDCIEKADEKSPKYKDIK